jgi:hypothetical protein
MPKLTPWLKNHIPGGSRDNFKTAQNTLKLALEVAREGLDGFPVYGPKAAIGAILRVVEVAQVRSAFLPE